MHPHSAKVVPPSVESAPDGSCLWPKHREEQWAAQSSPITRITSWIVLGIQALIIFSSFFTDSLNINILSIIAGFAILKGSQAWLRFQAFSSAFMACSIGWLLAPGIIWNEPVEIDLYSRAKSFSRNDLEFWTLGVSLAGVFTMEAAACILCLRTRSLAFWTKKARVWGGIAIGLAILGILLNGWDSYQARKAHQATTEELKIGCSIHQPSPKLSAPT